MGRLLRKPLGGAPFAVLAFLQAAFAQSVDGGSAGFAADNKGFAATLVDSVLNEETQAALDFKAPPTNARGEPAFAYTYANESGRVYAGLATGQALPAPLMFRGVAGASVVDYISKVYVKN